MLNKDDLKKIFESLDKLAILDWITPAFVGLVQQFKRLKILKSKVCELALERRKTGEKLVASEFFIERFKLDFACLCSNRICSSSIMEFQIKNLCKRCVKRVYCSLECKLITNIFSKKFKTLHKITYPKITHNSPWGVNTFPGGVRGGK